MAEGGSQFGSGGTPKPQLFLPGTGQGSHGDGTGTGANGDNKTDAPTNPTEHKPEQGPTPAQAEGNQFAKPPVATGGTVHSDSAAPKDATPVSSSAKPTEAKPAVAEVKTPISESKTISASQTPAASVEKQQPMAASSDRQVKAAATTHLPDTELTTTNASKFKTDTTNIQPQGQAKPVEANRGRPESLHPQENQAAPGAKALSQSDRNTSNAAVPSEKTQPAHSLEQRTSALPEQRLAAPPQEQLSRPAQADTQQVARAAKPPQIAAAVPNIENKQVGQAPGRANNPGEQAPVAAKHEQANKTVDLNLQNGEQAKNQNEAVKLSTEAEQHKKLDEPPKSPAAGKPDSNNLPGKEGKLVPEPNLSEAATKHGEPKSDVAQGEQATSEAIHKPETQQPSKEIRVGTGDNQSTENHVLIDKGKNSQVEGTKDTAIGNRPGEAPTGNRDGKQEPSAKDKNADIANTAETRLPGSEVSSGSMGIGFDGRPGRGNDRSEQKAEAIERGEVFKTLDGKPVRLDLTSKETCKQLLDLINQIETNKFKPLDQTGRERLALLVELEPKSRTALKDILQAVVLKDKPIDLESTRALMTDKIDPALARQTKELADGRVDDAHKLQRLEAKEKAARNFLTSFASHVFEAFNRIVSNARNSVRTTEPEPKSVDDILQEAHSDKMSTISAIEQTTSEEREQLLEKLATFSAAPEDIDVAPNKDNEVEEDAAIGVTLTTQDEDGTYRDVYAVKAGETYKSIAVKSFDNGERLEQLLKEINKPATAYLDDRIVPAGLIAGQIIYLPTNTECKLFLAKLDAKGGVS